MTPPMPAVVPAEWLAAHRGQVVVVDVRWYLDGRPGLEAYRAGHLPGATWVDLDRWLAGPPGAGGRHPLPDPGVFAEGMGAAGVGDDDPVVAYDDAGGTVAARLVWMLRALGHPAALLDGGLAAWPGPLETGEGSRTPAVFTPAPWPPGRLADADAVARGVPLLVDARAPERYRGAVEPIDPRPGHIPGAVNLPCAGNLDEGGLFRTPAELRARYTAAGATPGTDVVVYCGSGVTACHDLLALERAGLGPGRLYAGSWSEWSADAGRPASIGDGEGPT